MQERTQRKRDPLEAQMREIERMYAELTRPLALCTGSRPCYPIIERIGQG